MPDPVVSISERATAMVNREARPQLQKVESAVVVVVVVETHGGGVGKGVLVGCG